MLFNPKERGTSLVEYAIVILLVLIIVAAIVWLFRQQLANFFGLGTNFNSA